MADSSATETSATSLALRAAEYGIDRAHRRVIVASSLGTIFEWYDFYLYGSRVRLPFPSPGVPWQARTSRDERPRRGP